MRSLFVKIAENIYSEDGDIYVRGKMTKTKTICEVEFEKWWEKSWLKKSDYNRGFIEAVWNIAWSTCGILTLESIKKK